MEQRTAEKTDMMAHEVAVNKTEMMVQVNEILGKIKNTYFTLFPVTDTIDKWDLIKLNVALPILLVYHAIDSYRCIHWLFLHAVHLGRVKDIPLTHNDIARAILHHIEEYS